VPDQPGAGEAAAGRLAFDQQTLDQVVTEEGQDAGPGDGDGFVPPAAG
jgi:hypothetical protein